MYAGERINASRHPAILPEWAMRMDELTEQGIPYLFILDFDICEPIVLPLAELDISGIRFHISGSHPFAPKSPKGDLNQSHSNSNPNSNSFAPKSPTSLAKSLRRLKKRDLHSPCGIMDCGSLDIFPVPFEVYKQGFEHVRNAIQAGDTYLLNLCYSTKLEGVHALEDLYEAARAPYKLLVPGKFVLFSPEPFVSISDGIIRTFPMKGTIDASLPDAEERLLADVKEQEEHATVVDLLRNDLSIVARNVTVNRYRYISEIKTHGKSLLQCSSEISGVLEDGFQKKFGSLLYAILPAGSVTGAPKKRTVEIIKAAELEPRGFFTGVFGIFDGTSLDSAVMIRMIEQRADGFYYRSGGGITYRSKPEDEYQEMIDKVYVPVS